MASTEAILWLCVQMTLIHRFLGITTLKIIVEVLLSVPQVSSNVSPERTREVHSRFLCHKEPFFFPKNFFKGTETR